jgi:hypothetical protein
MDWSAIKYVTSGLTLAAFSIAAITWLVARGMSRTQKLIETAPSRDRLRAAALALERFQVDVSAIKDDEQKVKLALEQLYERRRRLMVVAVTVVVIAIIGLGFTAFAVADKGSPSSPDTDISHPPQSDVVVRYRRLGGDSVVLGPNPGGVFAPRNEFWTQFDVRVESHCPRPIHVQPGYFTLHMRTQPGGDLERFPRATYGSEHQKATLIPIGYIENGEKLTGRVMFLIPQVAESLLYDPRIIRFYQADRGCPVVYDPNDLLPAERD